MKLIILHLFLLMVNAQTDKCTTIQQSGSTSCHDCVEITLLGGRPNCAYCAHPYTGMTYCQEPFYPPSLNTPGFTMYACYNDSGNPNDISRYKSRCAESDCYIDQCLVSGKILWYYIVPSVIGFIVLVIIVALFGWKCWHKSKYTNEYIEKEENVRKEKLKQLADQRKKNRDKQIEQIKKKYSKNDFIDDEYV